jgi:hypothetical protein
VGKKRNLQPATLQLSVKVSFYFWWLRGTIKDRYFSLPFIMMLIYNSLLENKSSQPIIK